MIAKLQPDHLHHQAMDSDDEGSLHEPLSLAPRIPVVSPDPHALALQEKKRPKSTSCSSRMTSNVFTEARRRRTWLTTAMRGALLLEDSSSSDDCTALKTGVHSESDEELLEPAEEALDETRRKNLSDFELGRLTELMRVEADRKSRRGFRWAWLVEAKEQEDADCKLSNVSKEESDVSPSFAYSNSGSEGSPNQTPTFETAKEGVSIRIPAPEFPSRQEEGAELQEARAR